MKDDLRKFLERLGRDFTQQLYFYYQAAAMRDLNKMDMYIENILNSMQITDTMIQLTTQPTDQPTAQQAGSGQNQTAPTQITDFEVLLAPIRDQISKISTDVEEMRLQFATGQAPAPSGPEEPASEPVPAETAIPNEPTHEEIHIQELIKKYSVSISNERREQMLGWTDEGRTRYFRRKQLYEQARNIIHLEMNKCRLKTVPAREFNYWSKQYVTGLFSEEDLRQKVQELPRPDDQPENQSGGNQAYVEAKKEILEIANKVGYNRETAGEAYFQDIDSYAQQLASAEAVDRNELMCNITTSFNSAVQNYEILRKDVI